MFGRAIVDIILPKRHIQRMGDRAVIASDQQAELPAPTMRQRVVRLPSKWWQLGRIALVCYAIVGVFGATYGIVRLVSPDAPASTAVIWGICTAGPLALAFVWERLIGFKAFGVEFTLTQAFAEVDRTLDIALSASEQQYFTGREAIFRLVDHVIKNPNIELLELNLRTTQYWWSTRLYLQAALVEDYTKIKRLVFVDGDAQRRYVGMAAPGEVRRALAQPPGVDLESAYRAIQREVRKSPLPTDHSEAREIVYRWAEHTFSKDGQNVNKDGQHVNEEAVRTFMTTDLLRQSVALETQYVEWDRPLDSPLLQIRIVERGACFVPLTQNGRLLHVVNTETFAWQMMIETLRARLS
jgi:hypothetical protein